MLTAQMASEERSLGSTRQNLTPGALLNFMSLLQSEEKTAIPSYVEISFPT